MTEVFEKVELPSGGWAEFRDPELTTEAQRRPVKRESMRVSMSLKVLAALSGEREFDALSDDELDLLWNFSELLVVALLVDWSFEQPKTQAGLQSIPGKADYDALVKAAAKHRAPLMPDFSVTSDPDSPTEPSTG